MQRTGKTQLCTSEIVVTNYTVTHRYHTAGITNNEAMAQGTASKGQKDSAQNFISRNWGMSSTKRGVHIPRVSEAE